MHMITHQSFTVAPMHHQRAVVAQQEVVAPCIGAAQALCPGQWQEYTPELTSRTNASAIPGSMPGECAPWLIVCYSDDHAAAQVCCHDPADISCTSVPTIIPNAADAAPHTADVHQSHRQGAQRQLVQLPRCSASGL